MMAYCGEVADAWRGYVAENPFYEGTLRCCIPRSRLTVKATHLLRLFTGDIADSVHANALWNDLEQILARYSIEDPAGLVRLLRRMMVFDSVKRPTAVELLRDPYFDETPSD
jgi:hypothetical protein